MTMLTVMTMFLIYPFTLSHEHRHHRHHRHAYSEMTLAVYYCSKQKQWYYEKHKIRMTQGFRQGVWGTPQKCACGWPHAMLAKHVPAQSGGNQSGYAYKFTYTPEWISLDSSKNLDSKKWISFDSLGGKIHNSRYMHHTIPTCVIEVEIRYPKATTACA